LKGKGVLAFLCAALSVAVAPAQAAERVPGWLLLHPGTLARVDIAPWRVDDEPEAALTETAESMQHDFTSDASRPPDIVFRPVGTPVRIVRVLPGGTVALVHSVVGAWEAYARVDRLAPEVPAGTTLVAAGGFEGFSDFYPSLATPQRSAARLATGSKMIAIGMGAAAYDPDSADLVRVHVRVVTGALAGRTGWVPVSYTGLPAAADTLASQPEKTCSCRVVTFDDTF
jgi:hypothetical protein